MLDSRVHVEFTNNGFVGRRHFPGLPFSQISHRHILDPRGSVCLHMQEGDLVSLAPDGPAGTVSFMVFDERGVLRPDLLGLGDGSELDINDFDASPVLGMLEANGACPEKLVATRVDLNELAALRATAACTVWVLRPISPQQLIDGPSPGLIELTLQPASQSAGVRLPDPLGRVREEFTVQRGTARAYELKPGEMLQIIDIDGQQCSDFMALRADALERGHEQIIDSTATRSMVRGAYPRPGLLDKFYDSEMRPLLRVVQDTCGRHDTFGLACTARGYEERGFPGHLNCSDNISHALDPFGVQRRSAWPAINFFWNTWVDPHNQHLLTEESYSRPGDYVVMEALEALVGVTTACPDDIDPINGWNPTDIHVRIYTRDTPIQRAVAYRQKEDAPVSLSTESAFHPATSKLTTQFAPARDLWTPVSYPSVGTVGEYWACREKVTLQDMSGLRKYDIVGPDAEKLLQKALTRDVSRLSVWRGTYALMCDEAGHVIDDGTLFRIAPDLFRWCCGAEESARALTTLAETENFQVRIHGMGGTLPNLALQGPRARDVLSNMVFTQPHVPALKDLKWFGCTIARTDTRDGIPFMLARAGYTGELGYELYCARDDAAALWDRVMEAGEEFGIEPMGSAALETLRIEAGLAAAGAEFAAGVDAFEAGLGFAVDFRKQDFVGREALERNARDPRKQLRGLMFECDDLPVHGAHVYSGERPVGQITSATRSPMFGNTIAMARINVEHAKTGTQLQVGQMDGHIKRLPVTVCDIPFYDPKRERARA